MLIRRPKSLAKKMWFTIMATIIITITFSYVASNFFYEKLYVDNVGKELMEEGRRLSLDYVGGPLTENLRNQIEWYNRKSSSEVFVVSNPKELSACLPFDISYDTLISVEERQQLLEGKTIKKLGYEKRFDRNIMAVIVPLNDSNGLEGIIYLYVPLAKISELTKDFSYLWAFAAILFLTVSVYFGTLLVKKLTKPLEEMKEAAEKVTSGDYSVRVTVTADDEIGQLGRAFNSMSMSIQKEDDRKKEFLANVSHELRTPISYIKGYSEALMMGIVQDKHKHEQYLSLINREASRMERLVGDLLDLSRIDSDEYRLKLMPLSFEQVILDSLQKYIPVTAEKGIDLIFQLDPEVIVNGDEDRLEQIIQNIVDNALAYTEKGRITVILTKSNDECFLTINDTGIGIPEEDIPLLTTRFYRVNKGRTRKDGGTGLGLAITEKLIALHNGQLLIDSTLNKGTTVTIRLPLLQLD